MFGDGVILQSAKVIDTNGNVLQELPLRLINEKEKFYVTEEFNPPTTAFRISVSNLCTVCSKCKYFKFLGFKVRRMTEELKKIF